MTQTLFSYLIVKSLTSEKYNNMNMKWLPGIIKSYVFLHQFIRRFLQT